MDSILSGLNGDDGILDDLMVTCPNDKEHLRSLENTSPPKVLAIQEVPGAQNASELQSLLELVNYYRKFIPDVSSLVHRLLRLLMFDAPWAWTENCQLACKKLKELLLNLLLLAHYDSNKPVRPAVDTSYGQGAVFLVCL